jgi:division protein CdvB (Snf7/Vps24/ESCRT-III family)
MRQFSKIFSQEGSWRLRRNPETNLVDGVYGSGNSIFEAIKNSINKYLGNNSGSVIDFSLLKDAVDRHCDSVEEDISTQTPIPLYLGLAGTMAGVIIGLYDLLKSDAILTLMGSTGGVIDEASANASYGINALLSGVAWAMGASIFGIILTTYNSIRFKSRKLKEEEGKDSFLAWMQAELLPELPSDTSQALNNLVKNLNKFNTTFANNTANLGDALNAVNQSYAIQADIIKAVHEMDVMKMAKANVNVLRELKECTDKLEVFNYYLNDIEGYTQAIHRFEEQFGEQADRLHVLEEIRDFFNQYKSSISKTTADADKCLQEALDDLRNSTSTNVSELNKRFLEQSEVFKSIISEEKDTFQKLSSEIKAQFSSQMTQMPQLAKQLEEISAIPARLDKLIEKVEKSNSRLASDISASLKQVVQRGASVDAGGIGTAVVTGDSIPGWMKFTGWFALVVIASYCIFNVVITFYPISMPSETEGAATYVSPNITESTNEALATSDISNATAIEDSINNQQNDSIKHP